MPCLCRMKKYITHGLLWLYIISTGLFVVSLEPGYLDFDNLPDTNFSCVGKVIGGYYADLETNCQMFHVCTIGQLDEPMDIRFLCLNGTVFDQETRVCERIDEVDCSKSEKFYSLNLELYGNTAPPILEENAETESPIVEKPVSSTTTTTTTTTTPRPTTRTTTRTQYYTTSSRTLTPSPYHKGPSSHLFSIDQAPSFTPEEINISLNPGAPNIRTKPFEYLQHNSYGDSGDKKSVTTPTSVFKSDNVEQTVEDKHRFASSTTENAKNGYNQHLQHTQPSQNTFKYNFNYHDTRPRDFNPRGSNYQYHHNYGNFRPSVSLNNPFQNHPYRSSTQRNEYLPVTRKNFEVNHPSSTSRSFFLQPLKSPSHQYFRTEKPQTDQLPVPVLPTLSPIVFSSPAPFALSRHVETKRYTDEHELPPRIIISASASVSDASGRTLNYSLGTIGAAQILAQPPASYDDYKEEDVVLDPFYHDVPKIQEDKKRTKRKTSRNGAAHGLSDLNAADISGRKSMRSKRTPQTIDPSQIIKSEEEAVEVLKFLFDWYKTHEKSTKSPIYIPVNPELISTINDEFSQRPYVSEDYEDDQPQSLERSSVPDSSREYYSPDHKDKKSSYRNSLLTQATRGPSSNINNNNRNVVYDIRNEPPPVKVYEFHPDHHNTPKPPDQKLETVPSSVKERPYRGRHRFTFPYVTTNSPKSKENLIENNNFDGTRRRSQKPSKKDSHQFLENQKKFSDDGSADFYQENSQEFRQHTSQPSSTIKYSNTIPFIVSQTPSFQTLHESQRKKTQNIPNQQDIDHIRNDILLTKITMNYDSSTQTPDYTDYRDNNEVPYNTAKDQPSTETYINTFDYADDNYEPETYSQNHEKRNEFNKNENELRGIIHEETNINIETTSKPGYDPQEDFTTEESDFNYQEHTTTYENYSTATPSLTPSYEYTTVNEDSGEKTNNNSVLIDRNITNFSDVLSSLHNFKKSEENIYNYQQNLTEIKQANNSNENHEVATDTPINVISTEIPLIQFTNTLEEINTTEENKHDKVLNESEKAYASSTRYNYETTQSYTETIQSIEAENDEPQLYTSKPLNTETEYYNFKDEKHQAETTFSTGITSVPTSYEKNVNDDRTMYSTESTSKKTLSTHPYEMESRISTTPPVTSEDEIEYKSDNFDLQTTDINLRYSSESSTENITVVPTPEVKYGGRNQVSKTPDYTRRRIENMPVASLIEFIGRRRNSRRRQQNKPFYNKEKPQTTLPTNPSILTTELTTKKITNLSGNMINTEKSTPDLVRTKSLYESLPSSGSTPRGFYVTKNQYQTESEGLMPSTESYIYQSTKETNSISVTDLYNLTTSKPEQTESNTPISTNELHQTTEISTGITEEFTDFVHESSSTSEEQLVELAVTSEINNILTTDDTPSDVTTQTSDGVPESIPTSFTQEQPAVTSDMQDTNNILTTEDTSSVVTTPTSFTFSTLNIKEIETVTKSIAAIKYTRNRKDKEENEDDNYNTEPVTITTESYTTQSNEKQKGREIEESTESLKHYDQKDTEPPTEPYTTTNEINEEYITMELKNDHMETTTNTIEFNTRTDPTSTEYKTDSFNVGVELKNANGEKETTTSNSEENTTEQRSTKIDIITHISSDEDSTTSNLRGHSPDKRKYSTNLPSENETVQQLNRDGRKFNRKYKPNSKFGGNRFSTRHRFSSINVTPRNSDNKSHRHRLSNTPEIKEKYTSTTVTIENLSKENISSKKEMLTEIVLSENLKPTLSSTKENNFSTTPMLYKVELRKEKVNKNFIFNCFGKPLNRFYSDPRDCRLFHYCTNGYTKNQLLDMKFVCDLGTHFDDVKLVCTREIPKRCL